jgi:hypothetical protein
VRLAQYRPPRPGGNAAAFYDPMTLEQAMPGLAHAPAGAIVALADNILDWKGPARQATAELTKAYSNRLIKEIRALDPSYQFQSLGAPRTLEGQLNQLNQLRMQRAATIYRVTGDLKPLQFETMRFLQRSANRAYEEAIGLIKAGKLNIRLSDQEAIGTHIDQTVRLELRDIFNGLGISTGRGQPVRVNRREYNTSISEATYRIPDSRVGEIAFDVTLSPKNLGTAQVRGYFAADFTPQIVIIIRPEQLGRNSSYAIVRPRN